MVLSGISNKFHRFQQITKQGKVKKKDHIESRHKQT